MWLDPRPLLIVEPKQASLHRRAPESVRKTRNHNESIEYRP
jgi:hypothetical protein